MEISLYTPNIFHLGQEVMFTNIFLLFKTNEKVFYHFDQKSSILNKKYIHVTNTTDWNVSLWRSELFDLHFQRNKLDI